MDPVNAEMSDWARNVFMYNKDKIEIVVLFNWYAYLQYAHALSTAEGYRGYGAEQGNKVLKSLLW